MISPLMRYNRIRPHEGFVSETRESALAPTELRWRESAGFAGGVAVWSDSPRGRAAQRDGQRRTRGWAARCADLTTTGFQRQLGMPDLDSPAFKILC